MILKFPDFKKRIDARTSHHRPVIKNCDRKNTTVISFIFYTLIILMAGHKGGTTCGVEAVAGRLDTAVVVFVWTGPPQHGRSGVSGPSKAHR